MRLSLSYCVELTSTVVAETEYVLIFTENVSLILFTTSFRVKGPLPYGDIFYSMLLELAMLRASCLFLDQHDVLHGQSGQICYIDHGFMPTVIKGVS